VSEEKDGKEKAQEKKGGSMMKFVIMGGAALVLAAGGFLASQLLFSPKTTEPALEEEAAEAEGEQGASEGGHGATEGKSGGHGETAAEPENKTFALESFVVNLSDPGGKRYLKTNIELEFEGSAVEGELTTRLPQLRDLILLLLSSKTLEEVQTMEGKIDLRQELIQRINQTLTTGKIRNLYFTQFVIQ